MHIPTPTTVRYTPNGDNKTQVTIEPCYPGYGITIGNALRRVLLSSLPGAAVSAVKINGIQHEYDTVAHMQEDVVEIMMNLKKLRMTVHGDEPLVLELNAKGEKEVTAGDIKKNSQVEIANTDLVIATLTDKKAELSMEITVKKGVGYEPVEERVVDKKDIGTLQIDSIFSPVVNVGFNVEHVRVGQRTDYEKIVLDVTTDGSMSAEQAVTAAVGIIQEQFTAIASTEPEVKEKKKRRSSKASAEAAEAEATEEKPAETKE
ncbi:MAG: DNA-directed RNA polymerase subunit alpha [Candidatus Komeilibacteria bacterium]|nr:DNA-directed RNA polymerase subunit alpha [Candidatus Komeilibacteria bacterium]